MIRVSSKSLQIFTKLNYILLSLSWLQYQTHRFITHPLPNFTPIQAIIPTTPYILTMYMFLLLRNLVLIWMVKQGTSNKKQLNSKHIAKEKYKHEFALNLLNATFIETLTFMVLKTLISTKQANANTHHNTLIKDIVTFIPYSFIFELIFDFFHYWAHRLVHHVPFLYIYVHKKHHRHVAPLEMTTYYQETLDIILSNSLPLIITALITPIHISPFQLHCILVYKEFVEISGHCGRELRPTGSFTQFIWLPRLLNIVLHTEDHYLHHKESNCNYSKRFSLWDKVFGTYKQFK